MAEPAKKHPYLAELEGYGFAVAEEVVGDGFCLTATRRTDTGRERIRAEGGRRAAAILELSRLVRWSLAAKFLRPWEEINLTGKDLADTLPLGG